MLHLTIPDSSSDGRVQLVRHVYHKYILDLTRLYLQIFVLLVRRMVRHSLFYFCIVMVELYFWSV